jgi:hypothetical protein
MTPTVADIVDNLQLWSDLINEKIAQNPAGLMLPADVAQDLADALASHAHRLEQIAHEGP